MSESQTTVELREYELRCVDEALDHCGAPPTPKGFKYSPWCRIHALSQKLRKEIARLQQELDTEMRVNKALGENARYHLLWPKRWANHEDEVYQEHRTFMTEEDLIRAAIEQDLPYYDGIAIYGHVVDLNSDLINQLTAEKREREEAEKGARQEERERAEYERLKAKFKGEQA